MILTLVRYGETEANIEGIITQTEIKSKLTPRGVKQAEAVAKRLKNEDFDYIYASDINRSFYTAEKIAAYHAVDVVQTNKLRERFLGSDIQGKYIKDVVPKGMKYQKFVRTYVMKDAESNDEYRQRFEGFIDRIIDRHINSNVLIVGHARITREILSYLTGGAMDFMVELGNTAVSVLHVNRKKKVKVKILGSTEHLLTKDLKCKS